MPVPCCLAFPRGSGVKDLPANAGDVGSIPGSGRSPGEGRQLQCSCLGNPMDRGGYSPWGRKRGRHDLAAEQRPRGFGCCSTGAPSGVGEAACASGRAPLPGAALAVLGLLCCFCCSVTKSYLTLCDSTDCNMPGFPVLGDSDHSQNFQGLGRARL